MSPSMIAFFIGLIVGTSLGIFIIGLLQMAREGRQSLNGDQ